MHTILHLDESELIKQMVKSALDGMGVKFIPVSTSTDAYPVIQNEKLDLIVTSLVLKKDSIENLFRAINSSINKDTPVFIVTGSDLGEGSKDIINLGVSDYIHKEKLVEEISRHIDVLLNKDDLMSNLKEAEIAIIDDSPLDRFVARDILVRNGVEKVECFKSSEELERSDKAYDMYIVDAVLKDEYAKNLIMQLRRKNINTCIVLVTSLDNPKTIAGLLESGANDFIQKPLEENLFIAKLKSNIRVYTLLKKYKC